MMTQIKKTLAGSFVVIAVLSMGGVQVRASSGAGNSGHAASAGHSEERAMPADKAFKDLGEGNKRFVAGKGLGAEGRLDDKRRRELASGQKPKAIVLSCSDSRVPPELVFDQGLGEVFTVRVAGNIVGAAQVASMEYALEHLGTNLIVVMGHESCGAVKAALTTETGKSVGSVDLDHLVTGIQANLQTGSRTIASYDTKEDKTLRKPVMANVDSVAEGLMKRSKIIDKWVKSGKVKIVKGVYSLETGKVDFWGHDL